MRRRALVFLAVSFCLLPVLAHCVTLAIVNARIYTLTDQGIIERGRILIEDGRILALGSSIDVSTAGRIIDASGKQVTPGLMNAFTTLGLTEIDLVEDTVDAATSDVMFSAGFAIASALNPNSTLIPQNRLHGLTHAIVVPASGHHIFAGQGAVIRLSEPGTFVVSDNAAVFATLGYGGGKLAGGSRAAAYLKMRQAFLDTQEYRAHRSDAHAGKWREFSLPLHDLDALIPVIAGDKPIVVTAHRASDIRALLELRREFGLQLVIAGSSEAWMLADELAAVQVPVILDPMANVPIDFDRLAVRIDAAALLHTAGVKLLFTGVGFQATHAAYLVRQAAGNAAANGLPEIAAIQAMSLNIAEVFGFADRFGSLEPGKQADLVIWDGPPLELLTRAEQVIISGRSVPMVSRATRLRDRYRNLSNELDLFYRR